MAGTQEGTRSATGDTMSFRTEPPRRAGGRVCGRDGQAPATVQPHEVRRPVRRAGRPAVAGPVARGPEVQVYDVDADKIITVSEAEAAAGHMRCASRRAAGLTTANDFQLRERAG